MTQRVNSTPHITMICPHCGAELKQGTTFCPHCGSDKETSWSEGVAISKMLPNYASSETIESSTHWFTEYFIKSDSIIIKEYFDYNTDSVRTSQKFYAADPNDELKCYQYDAKGQIDYTLLYKPNEKGYSISIDGGSYFREFFFVKTAKPSSIRKTLKHAKIPPKARYFDLLGRFKFSK